MRQTRKIGKGRQEVDGYERKRQRRRRWEMEGKADKKKMGTNGNNEDKI